MWKLANNFHINIILFEKNTYNLPTIFTADTDSSSIAKNIFITEFYLTKITTLHMCYMSSPRPSAPQDAPVHAWKGDRHTPCRGRQEGRCISLCGTSWGCVSQ